MHDKYELKQLLQNDIATVVFTKNDGTKRTLNCTLMAEYLPEFKPDSSPSAQLLNEENTKSDNPNVLAVWDTDNNGWRSFKMDSIESIKFNSK